MKRGHFSKALEILSVLLTIIRVEHCEKREIQLPVFPCWSALVVRLRLTLVTADSDEEKIKIGGRRFFPPVFHFLSIRRRMLSWK